MIDLVNTVEMDPIEASITELIDKGKKQSFLTWEELNQRLPDEAITPDKLEIIMLRLDEAGIEMVDEIEATRLLQRRRTKSNTPDNASEQAATPEAVAALKAMGIEYDGRSTPLTPDMVRNADVVLCMTSGHLETAKSLAPKADDKTIMRLDPAGDIEDPIGLDQSAYDALARRFLEIIPRRLKELLDT